MLPGLMFLFVFRIAFLLHLLYLLVNLYYYLELETSCAIMCFAFGYQTDTLDKE